MYDRASWTVVNAEIVPIDEEEQVAQPKSPSRVLSLMARARRQTAFSFERNHLDIVGACALKGERLAHCGWQPVTGRAGIPFQKRKR